MEKDFNKWNEKKKIIDQNTYAILSQLRLISPKRFIRFTRKINRAELEYILSVLRSFLTTDKISIKNDSHP